MLTEHMKLSILEQLKQVGDKPTLISKNLKLLNMSCHPTTVSRFIKKYHETNSIANLKRGCPKNKITEDVLQIIDAALIENDEVSMKDIKLILERQGHYLRLYFMDIIG